MGGFPLAPPCVSLPFPFFLSVTPLQPLCALSSLFFLSLLLLFCFCLSHPRNPSEHYADYFSCASPYLGLSVPTLLLVVGGKRGATGRFDDASCDHSYRMGGRRHCESLPWSRAGLTMKESILLCCHPLDRYPLLAHNMCGHTLTQVYEFAGEWCRFKQGGINRLALANPEPFGHSRSVSRVTLLPVSSTLLYSNAIIFQTSLVRYRLRCPYSSSRISTCIFTLP